MYRDIEKVTKSVHRSSLVCPSVHIIFKVGRLSGQVTKIMLNSMGLNGSDYCERAYELVPGVLLSAVTTATYLDALRCGINIRALRYEDLIAHPLDMCRVVLEFCHLPVSLAEQAVKAFEVDSQRNSILAKSLIGHFKEPEMTPQKRAELNELLKKYKMPLIGEPEIIEGTLTCS